MAEVTGDEIVPTGPAPHLLHVGLATLSNRNPKWGYTMSLMRLLGASSAPAWWDRGRLEITFQIQIGPTVDSGRHLLVRDARSDKCTHLVFLDDDMIFPSDTVYQLLRHRLPIIAANCTTRRLPVLTTAMLGGKRIKSFGKTGLEAVDGVGCAVMCVDMKVFELLPRPWFRTEYNPEKPDDFTSEDIYFCQLARKHGFDIWIDHDLSNQIGHCGDVEFHHGMTEQGTPRSAA